MVFGIAIAKRGFTVICTAYCVFDSIGDLFTMGMNCIVWQHIPVHVYSRRGRGGGGSQVSASILYFTVHN